MLAQIKIEWVRLSLKSQNFIIQILQRLLYKRANLPTKILVFRTGSIGDNICALPSIVAIRTHFKNAQIHLLCTAGGENLVSMQRLLSPIYYDRLIDYGNHTPVQLLKILRKERYQLVIELPQNMVSLWPQIRNIFYFKLAYIPSGWGWQIATCLRFRQTQERQLTFPSETQRLLSILENNNIEVSTLLKYPLYIQPSDFERIEQALHESFSEVISKSKLIAIVPGAKRPQNRYPIDRFKALVAWIIERGYKIVIIGGSDDVERGQVLSADRQAVSFCGQLTPTQSAALLSRCFLTISNDTGPMHLSYAAGTPVLGIFSSRDFQRKWFPPEGSLALRNNEIHCSLCLSETCANNICMQGISLDLVKSAFIELETKYK